MKRHRQQQAPASSSGVVELTGQNLAPSIDGHPFAVVDFWAPSSLPSRAFGSVFAAAAERHPDLLFGRINSETQREICNHFNVGKPPTTMIFRDNIIVYVKVGVMQPRELDEAIAKVRALDMAKVRSQAHAADAVTAGSNPSDKSGLSIETYLRPAVRASLMDARTALQAGSLVAIRNAFDAEFARRMHDCLDSCTAWRVHEGHEEHFHYHHHNLYDAAEFPADLAFCSEIFDSAATKALLADVCDRPCSGSTEFSASWYLPGDHSLPHNDVAASGENESRQVAFVWHLSRDWRPEWGGALFWCPTGTYLAPEFNTLFLFDVGPATTHFVTHVSPYARGKRLAINGWWTGRAGHGPVAGAEPARVGDESAGIFVY